MNDNYVYTSVKEQLLILDVTRFYGIQVNRGGFASCPFHNDKNPSMKLYEDTNKFHCFCCGAHGDVIDLVGRLFNLEPHKAVGKLAQDFGLSIFNDPKRPKISIKAKINHYNYIVQENRAYKLLAEYCKYLTRCRHDYAPTEPENINPLFMKSLIELEKYKCYMDIFITGSKEERAAFIKDFSAVLSEVERALNCEKRGRRAVEIE